MLILCYVILVIAILGHGVLWVGVVNRSHALDLPRPILKSLDVPHVVILLGVPCWIVGACLLDPATPIRLVEAAPGYGWLAAYLVVITTMGLSGVVLWMVRKLQAAPKPLISNHSTYVNTLEYLEERPVAGVFAKCCDWVPGHQMFLLQVNEKSLKLDRLDNRLAGLSIVHLTDLHFSGRITRPFFEQVVQQANEADGDIVAITGDIIDRAWCLDWFPQTLGRLKSRYGVFFVLGNHDKRLPDTSDLRRRLTDLGLIDLGGRTHVLPIGDFEIFLAGNELPWFGPEPHVPPRSSEDTQDTRFRLLLAHTPDQYPWARRHDFDLMLAGHTHGGQVRLPVVGPVFAPSLYGIKYASGLFHEPPTVLHVSRGISGMDPLRWNCPPELAKLVLTPASVTP